jgi:DNA-binding beta-propeller fold protein YncE
MKFLRVTGLLLLSVGILLIELACDNQYRPVANPVVSPGGQPQVPHYAWVVNFNPTGAGSTTQIDVSGDTNLAVNSMGNGSIAEAFPVNSLALFVANKTGDSVSEYLPTLFGSVTTINLLPGSHPVALGSVQNTAMYVLNSGTNSACPTSGSLSSIVTSTLTVSGTFCVGVNPIAMAQSPTTGYIYVINQGSGAGGSVSVFNPSGPAFVGSPITADQLPVFNPISVTASADGNWIFIVNQGDGVSPGELDIVASTGTTIKASVPLGVGPTFSIIDTHLNRLYVANTGDNTISVFDGTAVNPSSSTPIPLLATVSLEAGANPIGLTPLANGSLFYVLDSGTNDVTVVNANSFSPLTTVALPASAGPVYIASEPTSSKVYVADNGTRETTIIQTVNNTISQSIPAPSQIIGCTVCALQQPVMIVTQ